MPPPPAAGGRRRHTLGLFREWGRRRVLLAARVNHREEIRPPGSVAPLGQMPKVGRDRCDVRVERERDESAWATAFERSTDGIARLRRQQAWEAELTPALR